MSKIVINLFWRVFQCSIESVSESRSKEKRYLKMANEKFCLRWTDFESNIGVAFRELREEKDFFDVTLVCNEDQIQAHKVSHFA